MKGFTAIEGLNTPDEHLVYLFGYRASAQVHESTEWKSHWEQTLGILKELLKADTRYMDMQALHFKAVFKMGFDAGWEEMDRHD